MANTKRKPAKGKPITSHPLFPAVVALWFGALFGLGSLAIRPTLIESVVLKTGIDLIVPAAAPPLGVTARILIALIMASLGAAAGAMLAIRLNRPKTVVRERKRTAANPGAAAEAEAAHWNSRNVYVDGPARRPISAYEELGETLDATGPLVGRRRPLAVEQEDRPFEPQEFAPLPGGEPQIFDIAAARLAPVTAPEPADEPAPLDLGAFPAPAPVEPTAPAAAPGWPIPAALPEAPAPSAMVEREVVPSPAPQIFGQKVENDHVPAEFVRAAGFQASIFDAPPPEPLFAGRTPETPEAAAPAEPAPAAVPAPSLEPVAVATPEVAPDSLGMTDLAKRLQESMARRRAAKSAAAQASAPAAPAEVAQPEAPQVQAEPAFVPPPPLVDLAPLQPTGGLPEVPPAPIPMPAALRPVTFDHVDDDDHGDLAALMPRHLVMPAPVEDAVVEEIVPEPVTETVTETVAEAAADAPAEDVSEEAFASLLSIEMPRQEFVRVEEPEEPAQAIEPVVIFPGQVAAAPVAPLRPFDAPAAALSGAPVAPAPAVPAVDPDEAERALRLALANLQRISGAA